MSFHYHKWEDDGVYYHGYYGGQNGLIQDRVVGKYVRCSVCNLRCVRLNGSATELDREQIQQGIAWGGYSSWRYCILSDEEYETGVINHG